MLAIPYYANGYTPDPSHSREGAKSNTAGAPCRLAARDVSLWLTGALKPFPRAFLACCRGLEAKKFTRSFRQPGYLFSSEARGFASPPRSRFAFS